MVEHGAETVASHDGDGRAGEPEDRSLDPARGEEAEEPAAAVAGRETVRNRECNEEAPSGDGELPRQGERGTKTHLVTTPTQPFPAATPTAPSPSGRPTTQSLSLALPNVSNLW